VAVQAALTVVVAEANLVVALVISLLVVLLQPLPKRSLTKSVHALVVVLVLEILPTIAMTAAALLPSAQEAKVLALSLPRVLQHLV
jgi:hypothetical protein